MCLRCSPSAARLQLDRGELLVAGVLLPHPAASDRAAVPQAAHTDDAQVAAAPPRGQVLLRRYEGRHHFQKVPPYALYLSIYHHNRTNIFIGDSFHYLMVITVIFFA